jgi:glycosyltransferase involved in cell wall biosynthesis
MTILAHGAPCKVSVIIKALNEQAHIGAAIESALAAVNQLAGEVVLADSGSTDCTLHIASAYPIRIVQLRDTQERSCGIGPQLGFQHSHGEYLYLMDGDMQLQADFLPQALTFLAQHPEVAGVGGALIECNQASLEYRERTQRMTQSEAHRVPGPVDRLDGGALYRRRAIAEVGYLSDRNLHSYEEFDLAARLRARGWKLWRLPVDAVSHHGHATHALRLMWRRWQSGYACGTGELLRAALGKPWWRLVLRDLRELRLYGAVLAGWLVLALAAMVPLPLPQRAGLLALLVGVAWIGVTLRKRSLTRGAYALLSWHVQAAGLVRGLVRRRRPPQRAITSRILHEPHETQWPGGGASTASARPAPPSTQAT